MLPKPILTMILIAGLAFILWAACDLSGEKYGDDPPTDSGGDDDDNEDCTDNDQDGWCIPDDCNDYDKSINPGALEICSDLSDNDCDFQIDQDDSDCPELDDDDYYR